MLTLKGRTACVIGIGAPGVKELLEAGMNVAIFTHSEDLTNWIIQECGEELAKNLYVIHEAWVDKDEVVIPALKEVYDHFGSIDAIVTFNGGPGRVCPIEEENLEEFNKEVPYLAAVSFNFTQKAIPYLEKSKAPRVVYISTTEAQSGGTNGGMVDAVARGAVLSLTYNVAKRLAPKNITVNCISVGPFDKQMEGWKGTPQMPDPYELVEDTPLKRVGTPADVAAALHYLLSEEASFITGQVINLNGGYFMG